MQNLTDETSEEEDIACNECRNLSTDVAETKFELALVWAKINYALDQKPCECESLKREINLFRVQVECLLSKLPGNQYSSQLEKSQNGLIVGDKTNGNLLRVKLHHPRSCHFRNNSIAIEKNEWNHSTVAKQEQQRISRRCHQRSETLWGLQFRFLSKIFRQHVLLSIKTKPTRHGES